MQAQVVSLPSPSGCITTPVLLLPGIKRKNISAEGAIHSKRKKVFKVGREGHFEGRERKARGEMSQSGASC